MTSDHKPKVYWV